MRSLLTALLLRGAHGFYLPGVNPYSFSEGESVRLKVNKLTSTKTLLPMDYYNIPYCQPDGGPRMDHQNLGEFLAGERIQSSPYRMHMKVDMYCEQLCITNLGRSEQKGVSPNRVVRAIRENYFNNWIVDNIPAASKVEDDTTVTTKYWQGFPVGFVASDTHKAYVHNHVNIEIQYHNVETDMARVVRFTVEPFSIRHEFEAVVDDDDDDEFFDPYKVADIQNPIESCNPKIRQKEHTRYEMVYARGREPQPASGRVLFTYDVIWIENRHLKWANRWDVYLTMDNAIPAKVHWFSIATSLVIVVLLSAVIAAILVKNLRRDFARYSSLATDEEKAEEMEESGWQLVHADVFRPPESSPLLMAACCGTGAQLFCMAVLTILLSAMGFLSPANRGSLIMAQLLFYVLMGGVAGYVAARLYKTFKGESRQKATACVAFGFPGISFGLFLVMDIVALSQGSSDSVPALTMVVLLVLWFGISTPLVFLGAYVGYKRDAIEFPATTNSVARPIPDQSCCTALPCTLALGGILPFGACFVELYFILASVWIGQYYYVFAFLLLVFIILVVTAAEIAIVLDYRQLCREDHRWWWRAFSAGGSAGIYVFLYSIVWFVRLEPNQFATYVLYFGYMALASLGLFLMMGSVGVGACLWFNRTIFGLLPPTMQQQREQPLFAGLHEEEGGDKEEIGNDLRLEVEN